MISLSRCPSSAFALPFQKLSRAHRDDYDVLGGKRGADPELGGRHQVTSTHTCTSAFDLVPPTPCHSAAHTGSHPSAFLGRERRDSCRNPGGAGGSSRAPPPLRSLPPARLGAHSHPGWEVTPGPGADAEEARQQWVFHRARCL